MNPKVAFFLPTRKGSQRVKNKNTRPFSGIEGGLVELKLRQLIQTTKIDEILFSSNDETCIEIAKQFQVQCSRIKIIERPEKLCLDSTNLQDLITYVPTITDADHILWGHVTTPMADASDYDHAVKIYLQKLEEGFDSLVSVQELKNFLLNKEGRLINNTTPLPWPRTQDLEALYEINHAIFLTSRETYIKDKNRLGTKTHLFVMDKIKSMDVDWEEDFLLAEQIQLNRIRE
nr:acylneuraminate cytidylyltransferase family protein [uncultured Draconibacterium sp.]